MLMAPKSLRKVVSIVGRTNVGKSSLMNALTEQNVSLVSDLEGTTTDANFKTYELSGFGPVIFYDTPGIDDKTLLSEKREKLAFDIIDKSDLVLIVFSSRALTCTENKIIERLKCPYVLVKTKHDLERKEKKGQEQSNKENVFKVSSITKEGIDDLKKYIALKLPKNNERGLFDKILLRNQKILFVTPIDESSPKGRMILPQMQALREALDLHAKVTFLRPEELTDEEHDLVVTDTQVVSYVIKKLRPTQRITSFSILFARLKGDFEFLKENTKMIDVLNDNDKVLIAEACSHTTLEDDIAKDKIPSLLLKYTKKKLFFEFSKGLSFDKDLSEFKLIVHCGSCMLTQAESMKRIEQCRMKNVPITNYGLTISKCLNVLEKMTEVFEESSSE